MHFIKRHGLLLACGLLFVLHQFLSPFHTVGFLHSWLDDFLCVPVCFGIALRSLRLLISPDLILNLPLQFIGLAMLFLSEWLFPQLRSDFTFDPYDFLAYFFGWLFFVLLDNKAG